MERRATIADVARRAEVGVTTVSRVMNGGRVSATSRARVEAAMAELDFAPNPFARNLRTGGIASVGVVSDDPADEFTARVTGGLVSAATRRGVLVVMTSPVSSGDAAGGALGTGWGGAVRIVGWGAAVSPPAGRVAGSVHIDTGPAARAIGRSVAAYGHRRVAIVTTAGETAAQVADGFLAGLAAGGLDPGAVGIVDALEGGEEAGRAAAAVALGHTGRGRRRPTAVLCVHDALALGLLAQCRRYGLAVPGEVSIIGFGDTRAARATTPALTSAHLPAEELGVAALSLLLDGPAGLVAPAAVVRERESLAPPTSASGDVTGSSAS